MARKDKLKSLKIERREFHDAVINFYNTSENTPFNYKQVSSAVGAATPKQRALIVDILEQLAVDGFLVEVDAGRFKAANRSMVAEGRFIRRSNGKNSVDIGSEDGNPIMVAERNSMHALNGDKVMVHISAARHGMEPEAEVIKILERKEQVFVGTLHVQKYYAVLVSDTKFLATDIFIPLDRLKGGKTGDKVVVRIVDWPEDANTPIGEVEDVLGNAGENNAEIHAILAEFGLPYKYPENVERAAGRISDGITPEEVERRRDLRGVTTFTIDPRDAKDFDDALSIEKLPNGNWEVGVHIADVTHYVKPDTVIDREAYSRATSVYLVDRTIPMLPERLCNNICSLRPDEDKLTHSVMFELTPDAVIKGYEICHTVTRSVRRFAYEEAQEVIETGKGDLAEEILTLHGMAQELRRRRFDDGGSVAFNRSEKKFEIDEQGHPVAVHEHAQKEANQLIEEFMLLANMKVAEHIGKVAKGKTAKAFVYRIHDVPNSDKLSNFADIAAHFGYKVKVTGDPREINKSINRLLDQVAGKPEEQLLSILAIRSMAKAVYSSTNVGHYGLAFDYYTHFTSPIRRYPDMMVHRLLDRYAKKGSRSVDVADLEDQCKHVSAQEQLATQAERASIKYKEVEYMGDRLGGVFEGYISGVTEWGIYVELDETHCEGLVGIRSLDDDFYEFDEKNYLIRGRRRNRVYQLGDPVTVQIARADLIKKQLDFVMIDDRHPAFTHRIDKQPITEQNSGIMARIAKQADAADRKGKKKGGGKTSRNYHDGAGKGSRSRKHGNPAGATRRGSSSKNKGKRRRR
ncbi:MAG: ribonuclease R [Bacteroidales bacterium]|nr:ribonuclease R [Candidatus Sodaliphilus limicaballi]